MARSEGGKSALIEVKAVDDAYPLYGAVSITKPDDAGPVWRFPGVVLVERALLDRLNLDIGSPLKIGEAEVTVGGVLGDAARPACRPPLLWSEAVDVAETLAKTGLVQPGSLIRWTYRVKLPEARPATRTRSPPHAPTSRADSRKPASPSMTGWIRRLRSAATPTASPSSSASSA